jgi:hypothetical protein
MPTDPFCTDNHVAMDPDCARFDTTDDPLNKLYGPNYTQVLTLFLEGQSPVSPNNTLNGVLGYVRAGSTSAKRMAAMKMADDAVRPPVDPAKLAAFPTYGPRADFMSRRILQRLYLDPATMRGTFQMDPPADPALITQVMADLKGNLLNVDKIRSFETRRVAVDILKKFQTMDAYNTLLDAKTALLAARPSLTGNELALTNDLLARIEKATSPYFEK